LASINSFIFITMKLIIIITFLLVAVAASMNTSVYASGLRLPSGQESEAAIATNNVTTIKANVFDKYKDTAIKAVVATANTKTSKATRAKGSKAPVYFKGSKVVPNQVTMKIVGERKRSLVRHAIPARSQAPIRPSSQASTRVPICQ
jgi:uncharacterized protein YpmB